LKNKKKQISSPSSALQILSIFKLFYTIPQKPKNQKIPQKSNPPKTIPPPPPPTTKLPI
jgi:hypothetical protein